jgi:hypothetical protein
MKRIKISPKGQNYEIHGAEYGIEYKLNKRNGELVVIATKFNSPFFQYIKRNYGKDKNIKKITIIAKEIEDYLIIPSNTILIIDRQLDLNASVEDYIKMLYGDKFTKN